MFFNCLCFGGVGLYVDFQLCGEGCQYPNRVVQGSISCAAVLATTEQGQLCFSSQQDGYFRFHLLWVFSKKLPKRQGQLKVIHASEMSNLNTLFRKAVTFGKTSALNSQTQSDVQVQDWWLSGDLELFYQTSLTVCQNTRVPLTWLFPTATRQGKAKLLPSVSRMLA